MSEPNEPAPPAVPVQPPVEVEEPVDGSPDDASNPRLPPSDLAGGTHSSAATAIPEAGARANGMLGGWSTEDFRAPLAVLQAAFAEQDRVLAGFAQSRVLAQLRPVLSALVEQSMPRFDAFAWSGLAESVLSVYRAQVATQAQPFAGLSSVDIARYLPVLEISRVAAEMVRSWPRHTALIAELEQTVRPSGVAPLRYSRAPLSTYRAHLAFVQETPQSPLALAGFGVSGLVASDVVASVQEAHELPESGRLEQAGPEQALAQVVAVEERLLEDWQMARESTYNDLYRVLGKLDASVPELLRGAWTEVYRDGPARVSKLANCVVEALDRALRASARDADMNSWAASTGQRLDILRPNGRWTRAARIRYVLRNSGSSRKLSEQMAEAVCASQVELGHRLQAAKHASQGDIEATKVHLVTAEAILSQLFSASVDNGR